MAWVWAAFMPHPPIIVPGVGGGREREADATLKGVGALMERLGEFGAVDRILLLSPHQPYAIGAFAINRAPVIKGGLSMFGVPEVVFALRTPVQDAEAIAEHLGVRDIPTGMTESGDISRDQGSTVPLYFLERKYGTLPGVVLSSPIGLDRDISPELGRALAWFDDGQRWGLLASGDLSHRLKPGAPAGFSPVGEKFDKTVVECLKLADASALLDMPRKMIDDAGECGMRSALAMIGLVSALEGNIDVISYEGPFGVGYCNAVASLKG